MLLYYKISTKVIYFYYYQLIVLFVDLSELGVSKMECTFVTGITGFLGQQLVAEYLERYKDSTVYAVVRNKNGKPANERNELRNLREYIEQQRLVIVDGDITRPEVFDDQDVIKLLEKKITEVWHIAGSTDFEEAKKEQTYKINVDGTSNIINLSRKFDKLRAFYHYSTAFIFHKGNGLKKVYENQMPEFIPGNTNNVYEESKLICERLVHTSGLPFVVLRPSIIMGHSKTAEAESEKMVYGVVKNYFWLKWLILKEFGKIPSEIKKNKLRVRGKPEVFKNLITVDDVIEASLRIKEKGETGTSYHLTNPKMTTLQNIHEAIYDAAGCDFFTFDPTFERESMSKWEHVVDRGIRVYGPHMVNHDPDWDMSNTLKLMKKEEFHELNYELQYFLYKTHILKWISSEGFIGKGDDKEIQKRGFSLLRLEHVKNFGNSPVSYATAFNMYKSYTDERYEGYIGYILTPSTCSSAVMVGDPISNNSEGLIESFIEFCSRKGFQPAAVQVYEGTAKLLKSNGLTVCEYGIENVIELKECVINALHDNYCLNNNSGGEFNKESVKIREIDLEDLYTSNRYHFEELMEKYKSMDSPVSDEKANSSEAHSPMRAQNLGEHNGNIFFEPDVRYFFAFERDISGIEHIKGCVQFDPVYENGRIAGYYPHSERYMTGWNGSYLPGLIIIEAMRKFCNEGVKLLYTGFTFLKSTGLSTEIPINYQYNLSNRLQMVFSANITEKPSIQHVTPGITQKKLYWAVSNTYIN